MLVACRTMYGIGSGCAVGSEVEREGAQKDGRGRGGEATLMLATANESSTDQCSPSNPHRRFLGRCFFVPAGVGSSGCFANRGLVSYKAAIKKRRVSSCTSIVQYRLSVFRVVLLSSTIDLAYVHTKNM